MPRNLVLLLNQYLQLETPLGRQLAMWGLLHSALEFLVSTLNIQTLYWTGVEWVSSSPYIHFTLNSQQFLFCNVTYHVAVNKTI
jgi:hypothetical protein